LLNETRIFIISLALNYNYASTLFPGQHVNISSIKESDNKVKMVIFNMSFLTRSDRVVIILNRVEEIVRTSKQWRYMIKRVVWENPTYRGTKIKGSDQTPCGLCGVWSNPILFVTYKHLQNTHFSFICTISKQSLKYTYMKPSNRRI